MGRYSFIGFRPRAVPRWVGGTVFYQVFPDRFALAPDRPALPAWATAASWSDPVITDAVENISNRFGAQGLEDLIALARVELEKARAALSELSDLD